MSEKNITSSMFFVIISFIISVSISVNLAGCAERKIAVDIVGYVNHGILDIASLETEALKKYASVTGANYKNKIIVYEALKNDVIPVYKRFLDLLKKIQPETEKVTQLHLIYVNGAEMIYNGFIFKKQALEREDESYLIYANKQIEKGRIETERWRGKLFELYKEAGIKGEK